LEGGDRDLYDDTIAISAWSEWEKTRKCQSGFPLIRTRFELPTTTTWLPAQLSVTEEGQYNRRSVLILILYLSIAW